MFRVMMGKQEVGESSCNQFTWIFSFLMDFVAFLCAFEGVLDFFENYKGEDF